VNRKSLCLPLALSFAVGMFSFFLLPSSFAQGTAFFYQGQLNDGGGPANGSYNLQFTAYNALTSGQAVSGTVTNYAVGVSNGLFTTTIDFGTNVFTGPNLWLGIGVCTNGTNAYTFLSPRQPILPVPYAIFANSASNLVGILPSSQLSGTLPASAFTGYTGTVAFTNGADIFSGSFSGNGAGVTNVNVTNLTGVLADAQLPSNTAYVNSNQTFTANNTFTGNNTFTASNTFDGASTFTNLYANSFSGSFFGNGLVGWIVVAGTTEQASIDHGYLLTNAQNVAVTLPPTANAGDIVRIAGAGASGWEAAQNAGQSVLGSFTTYGQNWVQSDANDLNFKSIASSPDGTIMAAAYSGANGDGVAISQNSGKTWSVNSGPNTFTFQAVAVSPNDETLALAAFDQPIYTSTNFGLSWVEGSPLSDDWVGLASTGTGNNFVAVASGVGIYTNSGSTWTLSYSSGGNNWTSVALASGGSELVASESGVGIFASLNAGESWSEVYPSGLNWQCVACSAAGNRMVAGVGNGGIYLSTDSGAAFTEVSTLPTSAAWTGVASSSDGSKLEAVAAGGNIYTSADWGATWATNAPQGIWTCVTSSSSGSVVAAGINTNSAVGSYGIYTSQATSQTTTTVGTGGYISGGQGSAVELQYIGNGQFMPVGSEGTIWGH
jgi:hypothetical protein